MSVHDSIPGQFAEIVDGMRIEWDTPVEMGDGTVLRADVFRPDDDGDHPVVMTFGPYGKGLSFQESAAQMWQHLSEQHPDALEGSSNRYQNWETVDPEKWVPDGYVCVRVDSRGAGRSPGYLNPFSEQDTRDYYECIEWAGTQPWSNGKVGLCGISLYAVNQWQVASLSPPHLAAIIPWEGSSDFYREFTGHGGIPSTFVPMWMPPLIEAVQHGVGERGAVSPHTAVPVGGNETLPEEDLRRNRFDLASALVEHPLDDDLYRERRGDLSRITVPVLTAANWSHHLHTRGNIEAYTNIASDQKWLEIHGYEHWVEFYTRYGVDLQKRFFGHFLKGENTDWEQQPPVKLKLRRTDGTFAERAEQEWPLARTAWTKLYLDAESLTLSEKPVSRTGSVSFEALGEGVTFVGEPLTRETELTGPSAARLFVASSTTDADLFLVLRVLDSDGKDVTLVNATGDPNGLLANGWLRASHRKLDQDRTMPYRPWHPHDEVWPLEPNVPVAADVEIWPISVIVPAGHRIALSVWGRDFELPGDGPWPTVWGRPMRGNGPILHENPRTRPPEIYGGVTTLFTETEQSYLLLPVIP